MTFSFTGLAFLLGFFSIGLLTYRFFQYWQEEKNTTSKLFFWFAGIFAFFMLLTAVAGLFFAANTQILRLTAILAAFLQGIAFSIVGYLIIHIKFPSVSPWWGFAVIFPLGLLTTFSSIFLPFSPYLEPSGGINWNIPPFVGIIRSILYVITFLPLIIIFIQQAKNSTDAFARTKAFGLGILLVFGIIMGFLDFFLGTVLKLASTSSAIALMFLSVIAFFIVFVTQKAPKNIKEESSSSSSSPKISW